MASSKSGMQDVENNHLHSSPSLIRWIHRFPFWSTLPKHNAWMRKTNTHCSPYFLRKHETHPLHTLTATQMQNYYWTLRSVTVLFASHWTRQRWRRSSQFNQAVRVRSLVIQAQDRGPERLRLRINCSAIDFTNFEDSEDTQVIELKADQVLKDATTTKLITLHPTKFNHVNSLHVSLDHPSQCEDLKFTLTAYQTDPCRIWLR